MLTGNDRTRDMDSDCVLSWQQQGGSKFYLCLDIINDNEIWSVLAKL